MRTEIPEATTIAATLADLGGRGTAKALCERIVAAGWRRDRVQLGIQRSMSSGIIVVEDDWSVSLPRTP